MGGDNGDNGRNDDDGDGDGDGDDEYLWCSYSYSSHSSLYLYSAPVVSKLNILREPHVLVFMCGKRGIYGIDVRKNIKT